MEQIKAILFAEWLAKTYADVHVDSSNKAYFDNGFNPNTAKSIMNTRDINWYNAQYKHFIKHVYREYIRSGKVKEIEESLKLNNNE